MDQRDQEEIFPLQLLLEAANEQMLAQANKHNTVAAKLGPHAYEPVDVPDALSPIACCALGVASNLNIPFNYGAFTRTMTRYARAHETSPGQYPHLDVRCLSFCMTHPSSATIVRRFVDIVLGRSPMLVDTPTETSRSRSRNASHTDGGDETSSPPPQETSPSDDEVPDVEEADDDETDPDVLAEREQRRARRRLREAVDPNCLRALEHNLGITFERQLRYIQDVKVKRGEGVRLGKEDAPLIDLDAEGFSALKAAGPKRSAAPKSTRAAQLKVLVAAGKIPSHRRGATAPPKQFAPRAEDRGWEVRAVEQSSVNEHQLVRQIQASHDALRNLLQLALDRTGVRMKSGVLIRTVMTQFINANHLAPLMSLFEVVLRSELPPIASATERVATKNERQRQADEQAKQAKTPRPEPATVTADESAPAPTSNATRQASSTTMVSTECQTSPTPTKVRIVYVKQNTTAANNATDATPRRTTSTEPPRRHMSPLASNPPNVRRDKPATTAQGAPRSSKLAPHDETVAANVAEQDYAAGIIQRVVRGRLSRKRVEAIRTQRQQAEAAPVAVPTASASLPAPAQARGQHQLNTSTSSVSSSNLAAPTSRETPRRERRPPLALNDELRSSPVQQPPAKAWFEEDTEEAANPQHRAPATPDAVRPTTKPDSRQAPHDRRPLPKEDRHTLAAAAAPPHEHSRRTRSSEKDSPMITITDEQGSSREQDGDDDAYPQHHTMPTVQSAPAPRQQQQPPQQETRTRLPPVPIAASSTDVRPELQPALYQLAARYQIASGRPPATLPPIQRKVRVTAPNLKRTPGTAVLGADGKEYLGDIEVALGLKKTKAMREREELKRRERSEADYFARNAPASRLAATPQPDIVPPIRSEPPGAPLIAPVQRPPRRPGGGNVLSPMRGRAHPTSLTPEPTSTATVGGVPFDKLSRAQQHAVIRALAASMLDSDESGNTLATTQPSASAERLRKDSEQRRRDEEAAFNDFMLEQQQRALFEEQQRAKRQQQQLRHHTVA